MNAKTMKPKALRAAEPDMRPEYDFSGAVRGKYYKRTGKKMTAAVRATGGCLCGAVKYAVKGPLRSTVTACHCRTCRRFSGGLWAGTVAKASHVVIDGRGALKWYRSSKHAKRGFCRRCGSSLFWRGINEPLISIAAGSLDEPTGLKLACHGWTSQAADYWNFSAKVPKRMGPSGLGAPKLIDARALSSNLNCNDS
jgi:hypothetical protein